MINVRDFVYSFLIILNVIDKYVIFYAVGLIYFVILLISLLFLKVNFHYCHLLFKYFCRPYKDKKIISNIKIIKNKSNRYNKTNKNEQNKKQRLYVKPI